MRWRDFVNGLRGVRHDIEILGGDVASLRGDAGNLRERIDYVEGMLAESGATIGCRGTNPLLHEEDCRNTQDFASCLQS